MRRRPNWSGRSERSLRPRAPPPSSGGRHGGRSGRLAMPVLSDDHRISSAWSYVSGGSGLLGLLPGAMSWEADHGISNARAGATGLAGGARIGSGADRDAL